VKNIPHVVVAMSEEEKRLKVVDVSFVASLKFWLAYLVVQIIALVIVFAIMMIFIGFMSSILRGLAPSTYSTLALSIPNMH